MSDRFEVRLTDSEDAYVYDTVEGRIERFFDGYCCGGVHSAEIYAEEANKKDLERFED